MPKLTTEGKTQSFPVQNVSPKHATRTCHSIQSKIPHPSILSRMCRWSGGRPISCRFRSAALPKNNWCFVSLRRFTVDISSCQSKRLRKGVRTNLAGPSKYRWTWLHSGAHTKSTTPCVRARSYFGADNASATISVSCPPTWLLDDFRALTGRWEGESLHQALSDLCWVRLTPHGYTVTASRH